MTSYAIVRNPGPEAVQGLTTQTGDPPNLKQLKQQHAAYCDTLTALDVKLLPAEPLPGYPDAYFVEDTAVVTPEVAVITRPGAPERRGEEESVAALLEHYRPLEAIHSPGTLDGGDVMIIDRQAFIGLSGRTNRPGADQLTRILTRYDYQCTSVSVDDGLHLKSSVTSLGDKQLLMHASWADRPEFRGYRKIIVDPSESHACNTLWINGHLIIPEGYPRTRVLLERTGKPLITLDTRQIHRMDGGLTCLSIRF